MIGNNLN